MINEKDKYTTLTDFLNIHSLKEVDGFNPILLRIDRVLCNDPSVLGDIRLSIVHVLMGLETGFQLILALLTAKQTNGH